VVDENGDIVTDERYAAQINDPSTIGGDNEAIQNASSNTFANTEIIDFTEIDPFSEGHI
jgi:hypothetical protein